VVVRGDQTPTLGQDGVDKPVDQRQDRLNNNTDLVQKEVTGVSFILR